MREIKFRGFDKKRKEWVYGYFFMFEERAFIIEPGKPGIPMQVIEVDLKSVGESTGLKDQNEKEIYERDICKIIAERSACQDERDGVTIEIKYFLAMLQEGNSWFWEVPVEAIEIIGNIYENPELLK